LFPPNEKISRSVAIGCIALLYLFYGENMKVIFVTEVYVGGKWTPRKGHINEKDAIEHREGLMEWDKVWDKKNTRIIKYAPVGKDKGIVGSDS
jgi:hypothetical protein